MIIEFLLLLLTDSTRRQDILTDDEIISDSYDMKEVDGVVYEVDCAMITLGAINVGMSTIVRIAKARNITLCHGRLLTQ